MREREDLKAAALSAAFGAPGKLARTHTLASTTAARVGGRRLLPQLRQYLYICTSKASKLSTCSEMLMPSGSFTSGCVYMSTS